MHQRALTLCSASSGVFSFVLVTSSVSFWPAGGDCELKAQEPQDLRALHLSHGLLECKECDQVFPDMQR